MHFNGEIQWKINGKSLILWWWMYLIYINIFDHMSMYCIRNHILTAKTLGIFQWFWWFYFKVLTLSCEEKLFALWARRFWIYDSVCTVPICCNHILTAKKLGIFQWFWWFSFKVLTRSCEEQLFALWARRFWIYDSVCTVPICCNHILTARKTWYFPMILVIFFQGIDA